MKTELKQSYSNKKTPLVLSLLCVVFGAICGLLGELLLPLPIAFLAALYLFDNSNRHTFSIVTSAIIVIINIVGLLFKISLSAFGPASIILAFLIYYAFSRKQSKSDASFLMTIICAAFSVVGYLLIAMNLQGEYTIDAALEFYTKLSDMLKESFTELMLEAYKTAGIEITVEAVAKVYDTQISLIISYLLIIAFFIVGVSFKIFGLIVKKCTEDDREISSWRFFTSNVFAYFYVILVFISMFVINVDSVVAVAVLNLYYVFMAVYAYVGFNVAMAMLTKKMRPFVSFLLLALAVLVFSSIAFQILAVLGVLFTIRKNNELKIANQ